MNNDLMMNLDSLFRLFLMFSRRQHKKNQENLDSYLVVYHSRVFDHLCGPHQVQ